MTNSNGEKLQLMYIFPNLFTAASAFLGMIGIIASSNGHFEKAAIYILLSLVLDGLDGRVARLTNTTSKFGGEFDSLADVIAFGAAPAMLFYFSIGYQFGRLGALFSALYVVFGAIRLARFNIMSSSTEPSVFIGIPIPGAAVVLTMWVLTYLKYDFMQGFEILMLLSLGFLSFLMVSNIRYPSFKKVDLKKANIIKVLVILIILFSMLYLYPVESTNFLITSYLFYGVGRAQYTYIIAKRKKS